MAVEDLLNSFLAIGIVVAIGLFIYLKVSKKDFADVLKDINALFNKQDGK